MALQTKVENDERNQEIMQTRRNASRLLELVTRKTQGASETGDCEPQLTKAEEDLNTRIKNLLRERGSEIFAVPKPKGECPVLVRKRQSRGQEREKKGARQSGRRYERGARKKREAKRERKRKPRESAAKTQKDAQKEKESAQTPKKAETKQKSKSKTVESKESRRRAEKRAERGKARRKPLPVRGEKSTPEPASSRPKAKILGTRGARAAQEKPFRGANAVRAKLIQIEEPSKSGDATGERGSGGRRAKPLEKLNLLLENILIEEAQQSRELHSRSRLRQLSQTRVCRSRVIGNRFCFLDRQARVRRTRDLEVLFAALATRMRLELRRFECAGDLRRVNFSADLELAARGARAPRRQRAKAPFEPQATGEAPLDERIEAIFENVFRRRSVQHAGGKEGASGNSGTNAGDSLESE